MKNIIYLSVFIIWGCSPKVTKQDSLPLQSMPISLEINFSEANAIQFIVTNSSDDLVYIHHHPKLNIERLKDGEWQLLRILPCPCGAPCAQPAEYFDLPKGADFSFKWNMEESWCGEIVNMPVPETIKQPVTSGNYRLKIYYSINKKDVLEFYKEFTID
ncbi:MAG: hypothetical protein CVT98_05350 [Bacteroidetes bacterium HGW-Bacteroidetes-15]|nr:MAG: hypothetical protein CVT98_05350 [Bacteroidetes bacterium HGW-Bacteroidetes-15]